MHTKNRLMRQKRSPVNTGQNIWLPYKSEMSSLSSTQALQWHNYSWNTSHYSNEHCQELITWACFLSHEPNVSKHSCLSSGVCPQFSFRRLLKQATHVGGFATKSTQREIKIQTTERILGVWRETAQVVSINLPKIQMSDLLNNTKQNSGWVVCLLYSILTNILTCRRLNHILN